MVMGKHSVQAGGWFQQFRLNTYGNNDGLLDSLTVPRYVVNNVAQGTISEVDQRFNIASPTSGYASGSTARSRLSSNMLSGYVHDNWKLLSSLTITVGLRYDYLAPAVERTGTAIVPVLTASIASSVYFQNLNFAYASHERPLYIRDFDNYSPYFGLAWKPITKLPLVVRGGTSLTYTPDDLLPNMSIYALRNPFQSFNVSTDLSGSAVTLANAPVTATPVLPSTLTLAIAALVRQQLPSAAGNRVCDRSECADAERALLESGNRNASEGVPVWRALPGKSSGRRPAIREPQPGDVARRFFFGLPAGASRSHERPAYQRLSAAAGRRDLRELQPAKLPARSVCDLSDQNGPDWRTRAMVPGPRVSQQTPPIMFWGIR